MSKGIERIEILGSTGAFIVVGLGLDVMPDEHKEYGTIIAAGPLVKQDEMTVAYRPVLWMNSEGEFIIHDQYFPRANTGNYNGSYFDRGNYPGGDLGMATLAFSNRVTQQMEHCQNLSNVAA